MAFAAAYVIQFFVFLLVAHFQPFSRSTITALYVAYQPHEKSLGIARERIVQCTKKPTPAIFSRAFGKGGGFLQDGNYSGEATPGPLPNLAQR
jgi:hypothetical protein